MTEEPGFTPTRLGCEAIYLGPETWLMGVGDLAFDPGDSVSARARTVLRKSYKSHETYLAELQGKKARTEAHR